MKVLTVLGTRPEIIRLSRIIPLLDASCEHVLVHTGQNYTDSLSDVFFRELGLRRPDYALGVRGAGFGQQAGQILERVDAVLEQERPDRLLVLGDTNSGLSALPAKRRGIPVFHMEAGNRCFDDRVPEEVNRRVIDHASDVLLPYTERSRDNLVAEGVPTRRIRVTGNPIGEVMAAYAGPIEASDVVARLGLSPDGYFLATLHRQENVDVPERLAAFLTALERLAAEHDTVVLVSVHPRTRSRLEALGRRAPAGVRLMEPLGFFDFMALERSARCVLSDSGTVQEECCLLRVPNVTLRDTTERPEVLECGSGMLSGAAPEAILACVATVLGLGRDWEPPQEYRRPAVSATVAKILLGYHAAPAA
jgi:UDP-N-acetylglucosamine 2-epimerase (non-hydrolysing)